MEADLRLEGLELATDPSVLLFEVQVPALELLPVAALLQEVLPVDLGLRRTAKTPDVTVQRAPGCGVTPCRREILELG